jgi:hypothetical protein
MSEELETRKLSIEERRLQADIDMQQQEIALREQELAYKRANDEHSRRILFTPLTTAIIAGFLSLTAGGLTAFLGGFWSLKAQQEKNRGEIDLKEKERQFQIVIKATENRTPKEAATNLLFFVDIGYLPDPDEKIRKKALSQDTPIIGSSDFVLRRERAKLLAAPLMTWIGKEGNFKKAKVMIKTWFEALPNPLAKTLEVESINAIAAEYKVATELLMDAGKPSLAKFAGFIDSLGSADNTMKFCVEILRFKMLEEAEKLVTSQ